MELTLALFLVVVASIIAVTTANSVLQLFALAAVALGVILVVVDVVVRLRDRRNI
jgi:hypothetical protein